MNGIPKHPDLKLLPHRIDWLSQHLPSRCYAKISTDHSTVAAGFESVTFRDLAIAVDRAAWWLHQQLEAEDDSFAYWGPSDLRWSILLAASIKARKTMIHASHSARLEEQLDMLDRSGCSALVYDKDHSSDALATSPFQRLQAVRPGYRKLLVPSLPVWLSRSTPAPSQYEYQLAWDQAADTTVAIFYSVAVKGKLVPIPLTNIMIAIWDAILDLAQQDDTVLVPDVIGKTVFNAFVPAEVKGQSFRLFMPLFLDTTIVLRHSAQMLKPDVFEQIMTRTSCTGVILPPGVLIEMAQCPRALALLRSMESVVIVGSDLAMEHYQLLRHPGLTVQTLYEHTEAFPLVQNRELSEDPHCVSFHEVSGVTFRPEPDGRMELVVQRKDEHIEYQPAFMGRHLVCEIATGDLYSKHLRVPDRWTFECRKDKRITLTNGEKLDTSLMEQIVGTHPLIKSALIYGDSQPRPLLLVEPWSDAMNSLKSGNYKDQFLDDIWPCVEEANETCSSIGQLCRELTCVIETPVVRTFRSSVDRRRTIDMVREEVTKLYTAYEEVKVSSTEEVPIKKVKVVRSRGDEILRNLRYLQSFREMNSLLR